MRTWTATTHVDADPTHDRLIAGSHVRVSGSLVGRRVGFDVRVHQAGDGRLALTADGPVAMDVAYEARPTASGS